jgi:hypothetical protein
MHACIPLTKIYSTTVMLVPHLQSSSTIDKHMFMTITVTINLGDFSFHDAIESIGEQFTNVKKSQILLMHTHNIKTHEYTHKHNIITLKLLCI